MDLLIAILTYAGIFFVLIAVHETGHYLTHFGNQEASREELPVSTGELA